MTQNTIADAAEFIRRESEHCTDYEDTMDALRTEVANVIVQAASMAQREVKTNAYANRNYQLASMLMQLLGMDYDDECAEASRLVRSLGVSR